MSNHTPEPWKCEGHVVYFQNRMGGFSLRDCPSPEDTARRIVACVNACAGMADPAAEIAELKRQRTALECATNHFPGAAKMVAHEGWQLVPVEPTIEMVQAATHKSVGFGTRAAYQAMLAAAPKHEGGAA